MKLLQFKTLCAPLLWLWQLPQNLAGLAVLAFLKLRRNNPRKCYHEDIRFYYVPDFPGCIALGEYVIISWPVADSVKHEYGHVKQSRMLGPLYLLVIGLPSLIHAAWHDELCKTYHSEGYYHFYTEKWANKLGYTDK